MKYFLFFLILFIYSCGKPKSVLICGDHKCVNKSEAKQYFEENLTIEVQVISKDKKSSFDLVELNTNEGDKKIKIFKKQNNKIVKQLSKEQIKVKKKEVKDKKKLVKLKKEKNINTDFKEEKAARVISIKEINSNSIDICLKLEKCDIESITDYLIKIGNEKNYPNISLRE